jgi:hypothetical protein
VRPGGFRTLCLLVATCGWLAGTARPAQIWLAGIDPTVRQVLDPGRPGDYLDLFRDDAPWVQAAQHVAVFKATTQFLLSGPEADVRRMIADLARRHIALGVEALMIPADGTCGDGIEGYSYPAAIADMARRVRSLGGELSFAAMDDPLWFGHHVDAPHACGATIEALAAQVARNARELRRVFPAIRIGDIEPLGRLDAPADWEAQVLQFAAAYREANGAPLDFVHADVDWQGNWATALPAMAQQLHRLGLRFGIIYNGEPSDGTDLEWTTNAQHHFEAVEGDIGLVPDDAVLQTWMRYPLDMLPEDRPGTMTHLVVRYLRPVTHLRLTFTGAQLHGELRREDGTAVAAQPVQVLLRDPGTAQHPTLRELEGFVPADAALAVVGLRVNTECGGCAVHGALLIGNPQFREADGPDLLAGGTFAPPGGFLRHPARPARPLLRNSASFAVVPGRHFRLAVPLDATAGMGAGSYVALMFLDAAGREVTRLKLATSPSEVALATVSTDSGGRFVTPLGVALTRGMTVIAQFGGTDALRAVRSEIAY